MTTLCSTSKDTVTITVCVLVIVGIIYFAYGSKSPGTSKDNDSKQEGPSKWANNDEIRIFREYLRIPTVHPDINYKPAIDFLEKQAAKAGLPVSIYYPVDNENPVVVMTWEGSQPELPAIMLNSHMDVVPVYEEYWFHPPFGAVMEENGNIYARGSQDMKCVGMQYLAAIRALKKLGIKQLKRTVYLVYVSDEELGGDRGMKGFVKSDEFKAMNIVFALDEGGPTERTDVIPSYYVENFIWQIELTFHGQSGHGSMFFNNTPGEKLNHVVGRMFEYRLKEERKLTELNYPRLNVTSINLTIVKGGVQSNVIPAEMSTTFDIRISVNTDVDEFEQMINQWREEAGGDITLKTITRGVKQIPTRVDDSNPFWVAFEKGAMEAGYKVEPTISGASTDMKYLRNMNISAIGFSPMINTIARAHDHNEYLNADTYLTGIDAYVKIIRSLGNC